MTVKCVPTDDTNKRAVKSVSQHSHKLAEAIDDPVVLVSILKECKYITGTLLKKLQSAKGAPESDKDRRSLSFL